MRSPWPVNMDRGTKIGFSYFENENAMQAAWSVGNYIVKLDIVVISIVLVQTGSQCISIIFI